MTKIQTNHFGREYARLISLSESRESVSEQIDFVIKKLHLHKGASVLDVGCGNGRHAIELAKRGYRVVAIDSSATLLSLARKEAKKARVKVKFILKDALNLSSVEEFDAAINMFSFGFFKKRADHQKILNKIATALKSGGRFILATSNPEYQLKKLGEATSVYKLKNGLSATRRMYLTQSSSEYPMIVNVSSWKEDGRQHEVTIESHIFHAEEIKRMIFQAGLKAIHMFSGNKQGEITKNKPSESSPVLVFIAEKQKGGS